MFNIKSEPGRYIINGIFATIVHFSILSFIIEVLNMAFSLSLENKKLIANAKNGMSNNV